MKFTIQFLTVLAATATLALPAKRCDFVIEQKYSNCLSIINGEGFNENYCIEYETENCQNLFKSGMKGIIAEIPECKNAPEEEIKDFEDILKFIEATLKMTCAKDEQGNLCPYSPGNPQTAVATNGMGRRERNEAYMGYIKESCKSKKCVDDYLNSIEIVKTISPSSMFGNGDDKETKEIATYLKSETCTAQAVKSAQNAQTSNTSVNGNNNANASNTNVSNFNASNTNASNTNTSNTNTSNTNTSNTNASNTNANGKTNTSNDNDKNDAKSGATQVTYSSVLFVSLAILLSALY